jgi:integrase
LVGQAKAAREQRFTFREIAEERMAHKKLRLAPRSYATDVQRLKPLLAILGKVQAAIIGPADIDRALRKVMNNRGVPSGKSTANRYLALLSSIFSHAVRNGRLVANPCKRVERFAEPPGRVRYLNQHDEEEEMRLRAEIRKLCPDFEADLDLALNTGMRRDEQWSLKRDWVDLERNILTVYGKGAKRRYIPINAACHAALRKLMDRAGKGEYLCAQKKREGQRDWRDWFERSRDAAGIKDFRWHDLRHTFASRLAMAGVSLQTIQQLLGHATLAMTMRYAHLSPAHLRDAVNKLGAVDPQIGMFP